MMKNIEQLLNLEDAIKLPEKASFNRKRVILDGTREANEARRQGGRLWKRRAMNL